MKLKNVLIVLVTILFILATIKTARFIKLPDWLTKNWAFHAMTVPPLGIFMASTAYNPETVTHELVHWEQWKRYGTFGFYSRYFSGWLKYGYRNNPMEIEAYGSEA